MENELGKVPFKQGLTQIPSLENSRQANAYKTIDVKQIAIMK